ncbi:hypothetical protein ACOSQ2_005432 [Xanthoceras sorbifolium]
MSDMNNSTHKKKLGEASVVQKKKLGGGGGGGGGGGELSLLGKPYSKEGLEGMGSILFVIWDRTQLTMPFGGCSRLQGC